MYTELSHGDCRTTGLTYNDLKNINPIRAINPTRDSSYKDKCQNDFKCNVEQQNA